MSHTYHGNYKYMDSEIHTITACSYCNYLTSNLIERQETPSTYFCPTSLICPHTVAFPQVSPYASSALFTEFTMLRLKN